MTNAINSNTKFYYTRFRTRMLWIEISVMWYNIGDISSCNCDDTKKILINYYLLHVNSKRKHTFCFVVVVVIFLKLRWVLGCSS
jgi:hypothetical protein